MAVGPIFKTQPNPTHDFTDPTQPNPTQPQSDSHYGHTINEQIIITASVKV